MPYSCPSLAVDQIHIWRVPLDTPGIKLTDLWNFLDDEERNRVQKFHFVQDQNRFVVRHGILRMILSTYLSIQPNQICYGYGVNGKPYIQNSNESDLQFNLTHSKNLAMVALTCKHQIGIDIEQCDYFAEIDHLIQTHFNSHEQSFVNQFSSQEKVAFFYNWWTFWEAFGKARGSGLLQSANQENELSIDLLNTRGVDLFTDKEKQSWSYRKLSPASGYVGAVVSEALDADPTYWNWVPN